MDNLETIAITEVPKEPIAKRGDVHPEGALVGIGLLVGALVIVYAGKFVYKGLKRYFSKMSEVLKNAEKEGKNYFL